MKAKIRLAGAVWPALALAVLVLALGLTAVYGASDSAGCPTVVFRDRLFDATFSADQEAWVVGYPGLLVHSTDGGRTWQRQCGVTDQALFAVDFTDAQHGWVVGRAGSLLLTADGGKNWEPHAPLCEDHLFGVDFVDAQHGWAVGNFGRVVRTSDGGRTWTSEVLAPMANASLHAVHFVNTQRGFVGGENPLWEAQIDNTVQTATLSNAFSTNDGGVTWTVMKTGIPFTLYDIFFEDEKTGWVVGAKGSLAKTTDGGATWRVMPTHAKAHLLKIAKARDGLWIAGTEGVVLKVVGDRVEPVAINAFTWLSAIAFGPSGAGVVVGNRGTLFTRAGAGDKWQLFPLKH
jgi:photosystem II stability/assembly factor-like uncharacterized protein